MSAIRIYTIATQQLTPTRWIAYSADDNTDCAHAATELEAMQRLIARWQQEAAMEVGR